MKAQERIIDRDIEFYSGCLQHAQQRAIAWPEGAGKNAAFGIVRGYASVLFALEQLAITLGKENPK